MTTVQLYYAVVFALSFLLTLGYVFQWHKHFDVHMTAIFLVIPVACLGYFLMYLSSDPAAAVPALQVAYLGGCLLPWLTTMCVASLCGVKLPRWVRIGSLLVSATVFFSTLTIGRTALFYQSLTMEEVGGAWVFRKVYGPMHTAHYVCLILYILADLAIIAYSYRKKNQVSRRILLLLFLPIPITLLSYVINHFTMAAAVEVVPVGYLLAQTVYLLIAHRMVLYDVSEMVTESLVQSGETGFITMDFKSRYLGSNETAKEIFPALRTMTVDGLMSQRQQMADCLEWLQRFREDETQDTAYYRKDDSAYLVHIDYLSDGRHRRGYQFFITDDTKNQQYIALLNSFNAQLKDEVEEKTAHIRAMNDQFILGMAAMVESRDNSTGGHIRRTSEGVRILTRAMRDMGAPGLTDQFCRYVIKAAPMHDLGKIAVDDAILRKPGRYTPEEFEAMKVHPAEGARIVAEILQGIDDAAFRAIAENVAHYHHERWDGTGYPVGLKGTEIPLESRIMAVADVYDALVSRRVYKEKMSFSQADAIILDGMGTQFDPDLRQYYEHARPALEAYYRTID